MRRLKAQKSTAPPNGRLRLRPGCLTRACPSLLYSLAMRHCFNCRFVIRRITHESQALKRKTLKPKEFSHRLNTNLQLPLRWCKIVVLKHRMILSIVFRVVQLQNKQNQRPQLVAQTAFKVHYLTHCKTICFDTESLKLHRFSQETPVPSAVGNCWCSHLTNCCGMRRDKQWSTYTYI